MRPRTCFQGSPEEAEERALPDPPEGRRGALPVLPRQDVHPGGHDRRREGGQALEVDQGRVPQGNSRQ